MRKICMKHLKTKNFKLRDVSNPNANNSKSFNIFENMFNSVTEGDTSVFPDEMMKKFKSLEAARDLFNDMIKDDSLTDEEIFDKFCEIYNLNEEGAIDWSIKRSTKTNKVKSIIVTTTNQKFDIRL